jgi:hypothetical protein
MNQSRASNDDINNVSSHNQINDKVLKFNKRKKLALHQLPFVDKEEGKAGLSFWSVPKTGGYAGGNVTGRALALLYLKHLRAHGSSEHGGLLQCIALDMFDVTDFPDTDQNEEAVRGQAVGFFYEIEKLLIAAVGPMGACLDSMDEKDLLKRANVGINLNEDDFTRDMLIALNKSN